MRTVLLLLLAPLLLVAVILCALALEPVRWCVVYARPWWRRPVLMRHALSGTRTRPTSS